MKKQRVAGAGRNNYINKIYFSLDDVSISKSIDFITLSNIHPDYEKTIYDFLEKNGFIVVSDNGWRMSRKPRRAEGTRMRSLSPRSGRLYCLDRRSVSGACHGNSEAAATR
jgi:hypothetical protein